MLNNGLTLKLHHLGVKQFIKFRVNNFQLVTIHFSEGRKLNESNPVLEMSRTGVRFCRFNLTELNCFQEFTQPLLRSTNDFYIETSGAEITAGTYQHYQFSKIGSFQYSKLDTLPYVGFSSIKQSNWTLEEGTLTIKDFHNLIFNI